MRMSSKDPESSSGSTRSRSQLRHFLDTTFAASDGRMPFERFMELALFDPEFGYYTKHVADIGGRRADFATAATMSPVLGQAIAGWLKRERDFHGLKKQWHIIEVGGGDGSLARAVLDALGWRLRRRVRYHMVDISPQLEALQRKNLKRYAGRMLWHREIAPAVEAAAGAALIFSNELVDAFPVRWLRWNAARGRADEIFVEYDPDRGLREGFVATDEKMPEGVTFADGQRYEVHQSYRRWLELWSASLSCGSLLTVDYGDTDLAQIYARRPMGTLRGYHRHQRCEGAMIYRWFGRQDLTCDVNFSDLRRWGDEIGWRTEAMQTQAEFFRRQLDAGSFGKSRATAFLLDDEGAGGAFKVLHQRKNRA